MRTHSIRMTIRTRRPTGRAHAPARRHLNSGADGVESSLFSIPMAASPHSPAPGIRASEAARRTTNGYSKTERHDAVQLDHPTQFDLDRYPMFLDWNDEEDFPLFVIDLLNRRPTDMVLTRARELGVCCVVSAVTGLVIDTIFFSEWPSTAGRVCLQLGRAEA